MASSHHEHSISLHEIDPSPVEEDYDTTSFPPTKDTHQPSSASVSPHPRHVLGLSSHSPIWYLTQIQKYSSYAFSAFSIAHLANTALIPLVTQSVPSSERFLLLTRPYYQNLPFEPLLIAGPLAAHIASGLAIRVYRRNLAAKRYGDSSNCRSSLSAFFDKTFWPKVSGISALGFALTPLLAGHIFLTRALPASSPGGSSNINLSYVSHAFARHPVFSYFGFVILIGVASAHAVWGWARWTGWTPAQVTSGGGERILRKKRRWYIINGVAAALAGLWIAGGVGIVGRGGAAPGWVGRQYDEILRGVPIVGQWLCK